MKKWLIALGCICGLAGAVLAAVGSILIVRHAVSLKAVGDAGAASPMAGGDWGLAIPIAFTVAGILLIIGMAVCLLKS